MHSHILWFYRTVAFVFLMSRIGFALSVNQLNGGATVIYIDFSIPGSVVPLELIRTYNSITAINESTGWNGAFGWGWTSPFETTLTTTPERHVLLRDGATGNTVVFKPLKEDPKLLEQFLVKIKRAYFEQEKRRKLTDEELSRLEMPTNIKTKLESDAKYRTELALRYRVSMDSPRQELYVSSEYGYQTLQFKNNQWIREKDGIQYYFDKMGRLIQQVDKNGFTLLVDYFKSEASHIKEIRSKDQSLSLKFRWHQNHISEVLDNRNRTAHYTQDEKGNLVKVVDSTNQTFLYQYLDNKFPHLMTRIDYPNESSGDKVIHRKMRYDKNGLIVFHRDKDGTETEFSFGKGTSDPERQFWTKSIIRKDSKTEERYDEFFLQARTDGSKYLYRQVTLQGGVTTTTIYNSCCGQPEQITRNGQITNFKYYPDGMLKEKNSAKEEVRLEYDSRWKKITKVIQNNFTSEYRYDGRGNLVEASNSRKDKVTFKYDRFGRISTMSNNKKQVFSFQYGDNGKPIVIAQKGVGSIKISYEGDGRIKSTSATMEGGGKRKPSEIKSQEVIQQVMKSFQQLLDIIRPAGISFTSV